MLYDIVLIGSGPNSLLFNYYVSITKPNLKTLVITNKLEKFHCTYGCFYSQIKNTWFFKYIPKKYYKIFNTVVNCSDIYKSNCYSNNMYNTDKYVLIDNNIYDFLINQILSNPNNKILVSSVIDIQRFNNITNIIYYKNNILSSIKTKLSIEATGHSQPIGVKFNKYDVNYQIFYGKKIRCKFPHRINKVILIDWYNPSKNNKFPSFCYIIPHDTYTLFIEETILITEFIDDSIYEYLEIRLNKRINDYNIVVTKTLYEERNSIILNRDIPNFKLSNSFGIGPCGNMINILSGYSLGYNIYHFPELLEIITENNFNVKKINSNYWNNYRRFIYFMNKIGTKLMLSFNQQEFAEFHDNFFKNHNQIIFKTLFLNCDNKKDKSLLKFINNWNVFLNYDYGIIFKIIKILFLELKYYILTGIIICFTLFFIY